MKSGKIQKLFEEKLTSPHPFIFWENFGVFNKKEMNLIIKLLNQLPEQKICDYLDKDQTILSVITNQSYKVCKMVIERDPYSIAFIRDQTVDLCILALIKETIMIPNGVYNCYKNIKIVPNPDHETTLKNLKEKKAILDALK